MKSIFIALNMGLIFSEQSKLKTAGDIIGEAYNSDDHQDVVAVTYG